MAISISHRAEATPRSVRRTLVLGVVAAAIVGGALLGLAHTSLFALRHIEVEGAHHRSVADVLALADLPLGTNVLWVDATDVARRIRSDPWIASATVTRSLPWSVRIVVTERSPVAVLAGPGRGTLVSGQDTLLGPAPAGTKLPTIVLPPAAPATIGMPGEDGAVRTLESLPASARQRVRELDVGVGGTVTATLRDGTTVAFGPAVDLDAKARTLRRVLAWERSTRTSLASISLVAPTAPAATVRG